MESQEEKSDFYEVLEDEAFYYWRGQMLGMGVSFEKFYDLVRDGIWEKIKKWWTDMYIQDMEDDLQKDHGWLLEDSDEEEAREEEGKRRWEELVEEVESRKRRRRVEEKINKRVPDIFDI